MRDKRLPQVEELRAKHSIHAVALQFGLTLERNGDEWISLCPFHNEKTPSFTVFVGTDAVERFKCFGCGEQGDVLDFVQKIKGVDLRSAISILVGEIARPNVERRDVEARDPYDGITPLRPHQKIEVGEWIELYNPKRDAWGKFHVEMAFPYFDTDRRLIGYVLRRQLQGGGKETPMVMRVRLPDGRECWSRFPFPKPRTLYNAHLIPSARQAIVVEGEKCADALREQTSRCVVTWPGGVNGVSHADWSPLDGKDVIIWPDADAPGLSAACQIAQLIARKAKRVRILDVSGKSGGWDSADAVEKGMNEDQLVTFMKERARPWQTEFSQDSGRVVSSPGGGGSVPTVAGEYRERKKVIQYDPGELRAIVDQACDEIVKRRIPIYARGTMLVRPVVIDSPTSLNRIGEREEYVQLLPIERPYLVEKLTDLIDWQKPSGKLGQQLKSIACPAIIADTIIARRGEWIFPQVRAVVTAPTLRPDGTILSTPGLDAETGILFTSAQSWPEVPDQPTKEDAEEALAKLITVLKDFPFKSAADRSSAVALILTSVIRPCLPAAPMFGVSAPTPGTGKSKLVDMVSIIVTGQPASVMAAPSDEEELRKHLGAALIASNSFITLDNIENPLRSPFLCQVLTQGQVSVRVLGESRNVTLPTSATLCATGNSLRFVGDLTRRVVLIELDAGVERPEERVFDDDILAVAHKRRITLVIAALTILRAFIVNNGPRVVPALGSFETWSNLVRSALVWLGEADPLGNADQVRDHDPERERTAAILEALPRGEVWTVSEIAKLVYQECGLAPEIRRHEALTDALAEFINPNGKLNSVKFGNFLSKHQNRILNGLRVVRRGRNRRNVAQWTVEDVQSPDTSDAVW